MKRNIVILSLITDCVIMLFGIILLIISLMSGDPYYTLHSKLAYYYIAFIFCMLKTFAGIVGVLIIIIKRIKIKYNIIYFVKHIPVIIFLFITFSFAFIYIAHKAIDVFFPFSVIGILGLPLFAISIIDKINNTIIAIFYELINAFFFCSVYVALGIILLI